MSLTLTSAELAELATATTTLLSPLSYTRVDEWRTASRHAIERLLGADSSGSLLPLMGEPYVSADPEFAEGAVAYSTYYHRLDTGLQVVRRDKRLEVFSVYDIYDWPAYKKTEMYADWNSRYRLFDSVAMALDIGPDDPVTSLHFYHDRDDGCTFGAHGLSLLRLLLPAFRAGVFALRQLHAYRSALAQTLDQSGLAVLVADATGRPVHATPALEHLLSEDVERTTMRTALESMGHLLAARLRRPRPSDAAAPDGALGCEIEVATTRLRRYRMRGSYIGNGTLGSETAILLTVTLVQAAPESATPDDLRTRFKLTAREAEVARLAAERRSAREIAALLGIRYPTARRHLEHVYVKVGVHTRAQLRTRLYHEAP